MSFTTWKQYLSLGCTAIAAAALAIAQADPALATVCHAVAAVAGALGYSFGASSPQVTK